MAYGTLKQESASVTPFRDPWLLNGGPLNLGLGPWASDLGPWALEQGSGKISMNQFKIGEVVIFALFASHFGAALHRRKRHSWVTSSASARSFKIRRAWMKTIGARREVKAIAALRSPFENLVKSSSSLCLFIVSKKSSVQEFFKLPSNFVSAPT